MEILKTAIEGLLIIKPRIFSDSRGSFCETYNKQSFSDNQLNMCFVQDNQSVSRKGVVRGLHLQVPPYAQGKLVTVVCGSALDVAVDVREGSPTFAQHVMIELRAEDPVFFWIPEGFAHGFAALEDNTVFQYKVTNYYHKESERAILWNDPDLNIPWNINCPVVSEKDAENPSFKEFINFFNF
jgi:dTDP-4-dehydrorhamnose 3,5-epimerase